MKTILTLTAFLGIAAFAFANQELSAGCCPKPGKSAAAPVAADYPLNTCVVSGEMLGSMGAPHDYVHKEAGKPDRVVRFCCKMCVGDFKKNSAKYLKLIDEAAAKKQA